MPQLALSAGAHSKIFGEREQGSAVTVPISVGGGSQPSTQRLSIKRYKLIVPSALGTVVGVGEGFGLSPTSERLNLQWGH